MMPPMRSAIALLILAACGAARGPAAEAPIVLRVGYFPNVTHAQGVIGAETSREGRGWFETRLGGRLSIQWFAYNAGPSAMEAIFAGSIDMTYVGPSPAINAYMRSRGDEIRVLAGAAEGGAALVVHGNGSISKPGDFRGRRIATPQLGNTQDVAARVWLRRQGFHVTMTGGDVLVAPAANADQLGLFESGDVDAVWTVEPWVSRLEQDAGGKIFLEQTDAITTVLVSSAAFLRDHRDLAERFREAHAALTRWIVAHPKEARLLVQRGLSAEMQRPFPPALVDRAWSRLRFTDAVDPRSFDALVADAQSVGFLRLAVPLDRLFPALP